MDGQNMPNMRVVKGLLATSLGVIFMLYAYKMIIHVILFTTGALLVYYGLLMLNIPVVTNVLHKVKSFFVKCCPKD
jgi:hypothetical protein